MASTEAVMCVFRWILIKSRVYFKKISKYFISTKCPHFTYFSHKLPQRWHKPTKNYQKFIIAQIMSNLIILIMCVYVGILKNTKQKYDVHTCIPIDKLYWVLLLYIVLHNYCKQFFFRVTGNRITKALNRRIHDDF